MVFFIYRSGEQSKILLCHERLRMEKFANVIWRLAIIILRFLRHIGGVQHATHAYEKRKKVWRFNESTTRKQGLRSDDIRVRQIDHDPKDTFGKRRNSFSTWLCRLRISHALAILRSQTVSEKWEFRRGISTNIRSSKTGLPCLPWEIITQHHGLFTRGRIVGRVRSWLMLHTWQGCKKSIDDEKPEHRSASIFCRCKCLPFYTDNAFFPSKDRRIFFLCRKKMLYFF